MIFVQFITALIIYTFYYQSIRSIVIEIDGEIDLGDIWQHEYPRSHDTKTYPQLRTDKLNNVTSGIDYTPVFKYKSPSSTKLSFGKKTETNNKIQRNNNKTQRHRKKKRTKAPVDSLDHDNIDRDVTKVQVTKILDTHKSVEKARVVSEDKKIHDFIQHIFKQTLKVFNDIKTKTTDVKMKREINKLKHTFKDKFTKYMSETDKHTLKTNLAKQKIILNTIDTSHKLLQRLINNLHKNKDALRANVANALKKEVHRENDLENKHACDELNVCRLSDFSEFVTDIIIIILMADNVKVKQAADAMTEVVKNTDFDNVLNYDLEKKLKRYIGNIENWNAFMTRAMFLAVKTMLTNKNKPIAIFNGQDNYLANKTLAFQDIISMVDDRLPKNENIKEWEKIKQDLIDWKEDRNKEPLKIAESFFKLLKEKVLDVLDYEGKKRFSRSVGILLSHF